MASSSKESAAKGNLFGKRKKEDDLETKPILKKRKEISEEKETTKELIEGRVELSETKSGHSNLISVEETVEELDETPDFVEEAAEPKKTLFVANLSHRRNEISPIIDFFKDVGQVVRVRLVATRRGKRMGCGFVEFASASEAKKALEKKNGEYLHNRKIILHMAHKGTTYLPIKYCIDHTVWFKDYPQQERLPIEEDEAPPDFVEEVLFVANLSPQTTRISHIINFFKDVGKVVSVRLIVNHEGKHVGHGVVEFASANEAKRALEKKNGEYLHDRKVLLMKALDENPDSVEAVDLRNKTLFVAHLSGKTDEISHIIDFFKDVGQVVRVRIMVTPKGKRVGCGFVEFASADEATKALEKNGECLHGREIILDVADKETAYLPPKYCLDHTVWYEGYPRRESLLIEEDEAEEGLDETPDFIEEVAVREKTLFVAGLSKNIRISKIIRIFEDVGEVVRVRLIVDHKGERLGCCFVEFASANEAKKALQEKNGSKNFRSKILLNAAEIAPPYPFRPKFKIAEKLWNEDNILRREGLDLETEQKTIFCGKKITFSDDE